MTDEANVIRDFLVCREDCPAWGNPRMICDCGCGRAKAALAVLESKSGWTSVQQDEINRLHKILNTILAPTDGFVWTAGIIKDYIRENNTEGDLELEQDVDEF